MALLTIFSTQPHACRAIPYSGAYLASTKAHITAYHTLILVVLIISITDWVGATLFILAWNLDTGALLRVSCQNIVMEH